MAIKGNQFWKLRSKHGRNTLFETPELMWEAACEYFTWCEKNPWYKIEQIKNPGKSEYDQVKGKWMTPPQTMKMPVARPYTMQGLCAYLDCNTVYFNHFEKSLTGKDDALSIGFSKVVTRIRETIFQQKFEGAAIGLYNSNIIARELGISEKQETTVAAPDGAPLRITLNL